MKPREGVFYSCGGIPDCMLHKNNMSDSLQHQNFFQKGKEKGNDIN
jgi:hypothetical protein